jgi:hypothetical protein
VSNYDDLMASMGVRRLDQRSSGKGRGKPKGKTAAAATRPPAARADAPVAPPPRPEPPSPTPVDRQELDGMKAEVGRLRGELQAERDRAEGLSAELDHVRGEAAEREAAVDALQHQRDTLDAERRGLQRRLEIARGDIPPPAPAVSEILGKRGLLGELEAANLLRAVADARHTGELLRLLEPVDTDRLEQFLDERVALLGGCDDCPSTGGRAVVRVPRERCEVCGGSDIQRGVRSFVDACLVNGLTRVVVVGGSPKYHRQLRELVQHHRLKLTLVSGKARRTARQAKSDQEHNDLVLLWGGTLLDHSVSALYGDGPARVLTVPHRGISLMLQRAAELLTGGR